MLILNAFGQILLNVQCDVAVAKTSLTSVRVCSCVVAVDLNGVMANDALTPPPLPSSPCLHHVGYGASCTGS